MAKPPPGGVIQDTDKGAKALLEKLGQVLPDVTVGFHEDAGVRDDQSGLSVIDVVAFHEFGLGVPRRSIVGDWADQKADEIKARSKAAAEAILKGADMRQQFERLGLWAQGSMQARMAEGIPPPLAQSTIDHKGSSVPLIDTGQTRASITYRITPKGEG